MIIAYIAMSIMAVLFGAFVVAFVIASICDLVTARERKRDFDDSKRPARK